MIFNPQLEYCCQMERVREIMSLLSPKQFEVVLLTFDGYSVSQAAEILGLTGRSTAQYRLKLAGQKILKEYPEYWPIVQGCKRPISRIKLQDLDYG